MSFRLRFTNGDAFGKAHEVQVLLGSTGFSTQLEILRLGVRSPVERGMADMVEICWNRGKCTRGSTERIEFEILW